MRELMLAGAPPRFRHSSQIIANAARACLLIATATVLTACASTRPSPDVEPAIALATGISTDIAFHVEGGPLDEPAFAGDRLSLAEVVNRAITTDPGLQAALARVRMALADSDQARLLPNPILNLALRFPENGGPAIIEASLAQDLISILRLPRQTSAADNRLRQAAVDAITVAIDVASDVQERYATVQALDELVPVLEQRRELLDRLVDLAQSRLQAGEGRRQDVTVLEAQRVELDVEIAATEQERRDERLQLARLIGEPSSAATWTLDQWTPPERADAPESAWVEAALQNRPEIQSVAWRLAMLGDDLALTRLLPFDGASAGLSAEDDDGWSVGPEVSMPLPIFDMGQARRARVTAEQIEARHDMTRTKRMVVEDVRRAFEALERTSANLRRVRDELIPLQEQRLGNAEAMFRAERDITSLILAEQDLRGAQARAVDLERQMTVPLVRLQRAVGGSGIARRIVASPSPTTDAVVTLATFPIDSTSARSDDSQEEH